MAALAKKSLNYQILVLIGFYSIENVNKNIFDIFYIDKVCIKECHNSKISLLYTYLILKQ